MNNHWKGNRNQGGGNRQFSDGRDFQRSEFHDLIKTMRKIDDDKIGFLDDVNKFTELTRITANQLRNLYDIIVSMNPNDPKDFKTKLSKARIMLEYAKKRDTLKDHGFFYEPMKALLEDLLKTSDDKRIGDFKQLMEAIVAYSKKG